MKYYIQIDCMGREKPIIQEFTKNEILKAFESIMDKCVNNEGFIILSKKDDDGFISLSRKEEDYPTPIAIRKSSIYSISVFAKEE